MESFYTYVWAPKPRFERPVRKPQAEGEAGAPREGNRDGRNDRRKGGENRAKPAEGEGGAPKEPRKDRGEYKGDRGDKGGAGRKDGDRKGGERGDRNDRKGGKPQRDDFKPKTFESRPARPEKPIDPDNPFAALMALKSKL